MTTMHRSDHVDVPSTLATVRLGHLPNAAAAPVAIVNSGGTITFNTVSHEGILPDQGGDPVAFFGQFGIARNEILDDVLELAVLGRARDPLVDGPHVVTGPVAVHGAQPGDLLRIETVNLERRVDYGIVSNRHGKGVLAGEFPHPDAHGNDVAVACTLARVVSDRRGELIEGRQRIGFRLGEFLGLVGLAPATEDEPSSTPPGNYGGNLDIRHLGVGSTLFVPVASEGALVYAGDPHFAQGNGEVALTAFEAPLRATLRVTVEGDAASRRLAQLLACPFGETADAHIAVGIAATLDEAMRQALRNAITLVTQFTGVTESLALAYLSAAGDFEISQAVNGIKGVHCMIRKDDLQSAQLGAE